MTETLTALERQELVDLEKVIRRGLDSFITVGECLMEIRTKRLYKEKYSSFESYAMAEFTISKVHGHRLINAFKVSSNLNGQTPTSESQVRAIAQFTPDTQRAIWGAACESNPKGPTAENVESVIDSLTTRAWDSLPDKDKMVLAKRSKAKIIARSSRMSIVAGLKKARIMLAKALKALKSTDMPSDVVATVEAVLERVEERLEE